MTQPTSSRFGLPLLAENQNSAEITVNQFTNLMEALNGGGLIPIVESNLNTPPGSPTNGQVWVIGSSPTGAWASNADELVIYLDGWFFFDISSADLSTPVMAFDATAKEMIAFSPFEDLWYPVQDRWSATQHWTGRYQNGVKLYSKSLLNITAPGSLATVNTAHSITSLNLDERINFEICWFHNTGGAVAFSAPLAQVQHTIDGTNFAMVDGSGMDWSAWRVDVRLEYTVD